MKKTICLILAVLMLFSVINVSVVAVNIATPKAVASNDVGGVKVYWNKVDGAVKYNVYRRVGGSSSWVLAGTTTGTLIIDKGVSNGKYYAYSVRAYDVNNNYSVYDKNMTYIVKCVATPKLTGLTNDTNGLKLTWGTVPGANYRVYRRGAGSFTWTYLGTTSNTTFTDSKAISGQYWRYTVRAISSGYYSGFDTNGLYTMRLANPYSIKAELSDGSVSVSWAKINGATGYRVYRRGAGQTYWTYLGATSACTFKDTRVTYGQYYRYTVRATRGNVYSCFYTEGAVIKFTRDIVTSSEICKINGKLYASYPVGHIKDSTGKYTILSNYPSIPRLPVRPGDDIGEIAYYKGYVYYTSTVSLYEGTYNLYRCKADFTDNRLLLNDSGSFFVIFNDKIYFNTYYVDDCIDLKDLRLKDGELPSLKAMFSVGEEYGVPCIKNDEAVMTHYDSYSGREDVYYFNGTNKKYCFSGSGTFMSVYSYIDVYIYYSEQEYTNPYATEYDPGRSNGKIILKRYNVKTGQINTVDIRHTDDLTASSMFFPYLYI